MCLLTVFAVGHAAEPTTAAMDGQKPVETTAQHDARLQWFRDAKFGMFIHWGVFSVPAGEYHGKEINGYGEWIMKNCQIPVAEYRDYAKDFTASKYDPEAWAKLAKVAGMKYVVLTSKHHEGFTLYDSQASDWTAVKASGAHRDLITPLAAAVRAEGLKFGLYYSQDLDWVNPGGGMPGADWDPVHKGSFDEYLRTISLPQVDEILTRFHPDVIWWDMALHMTPERAAPFAERIGHEKNLISNNRLGGGFPGDTTTPEQYIPPRGYPGKLFEVCMTMNDTWGYKADDQNWKSSRDLVRKLSDICSKGGNFLLNIGPTKEGIIPPACVERLQTIGRWMHVNGEAIYATEASPFARRLPWGRVTRKHMPGDGETLYLHVWEWPADGVLLLPGVDQTPTAGRVLADGAEVTSESKPEGLAVKLPGTPRDPDISVVVLTFDKPVVITRDNYPATDKDGRIALSPYDADAIGHNNDTFVPVGTGADAYLPHWNSSRISLEYQVKIPATGVWTVSAEVAAAKPTGLRTRTASNSSLTIVPATGGPGQWQTVELGRVHLQAGTTSFQLVPKNQGWNGMDLRRVWLTPSSLPPTVVTVSQAAEGTITLEADDASLVNRKDAPVTLRCESGGDIPNLGYWTMPDDNAVWQAEVSRPGNFTARCTYAGLENAVPYSLSVGTQVLHGTLAGTGDYGVYRTVDLGTVTIAEAGTRTVTFSPDRKGAFCNLRELVLTPVKP